MPKKKGGKSSPKTSKKKKLAIRDTDNFLGVDEVKGPASLQTFWDETLVPKYNELMSYFRDRGLLSFFKSPFQAQNRMFLKLFVIFLGLFLGVFLRWGDIRATLRAQNSQSEIAQIKDTTLRGGSLAIKAIASSQYNNGHVIAFSVDGETSEGVSSLTKDYGVYIAAVDGVSDYKSVTYRTLVVPVSINKRILLVYVDASKTSGRGSYDITIHHKKLMTKKDAYKNMTFRVTLSSAQNTNALYNASGISLDNLASKLSGDTTSTKIYDAAVAYNKALEIYNNNLERLEAQGVELSPTGVELGTYVMQHSILGGLFDDASISSIADYEGVTSDDVPISSSGVEMKLEASGKVYTLDSSNQDETDPYYSELQTANTLMQKVVSAGQTLNNVRYTLYTSLYKLSVTLEDGLVLDDFSGSSQVEAYNSSNYVK